MNAVVLCAGFATRLLPLTREKAKPLLPVAGTPIVEHLLRALGGTQSPVTHVTLVSNRRFYSDFVRWTDSIRARYSGVDMTVLDNGVECVEERRGAVGDLAWALEKIDTAGPILVSAGDNLFRMSFEAFWKDVRSFPGSCITTYREKQLERLKRTGVAEIASDRRVIRVEEKPQAPLSDWACPALYVLTDSAAKAVTDYLEETGQAENLGGFIGWLVERYPVYAHEMRGERWDIGNLRNYQMADQWLSGELANE